MSKERSSDSPHENMWGPIRGRKRRLRLGIGKTTHTTEQEEVAMPLNAYPNCPSKKERDDLMQAQRQEKQQAPQVGAV